MCIQSHPPGRLPIDGFAEGLFSVNMKDENGKMQKFYLFDKPDEGRTIRAVFTQGLRHTHHLIEPAGQLRHEQPSERFQVLVEAEAKQRQLPAMDASGGIGNKKQSKRLCTLNEMQQKVDAVIASREHNEKKNDEADPAAAEEAMMPADMTEALVRVDLIENVYGGSSGPAAPKKKATKRPPGANGGGNATTAPKRKARRTPDQPVVTAPPPMAGPSFEEPSESPMDKLADEIKNKLGVESKGVRNLSLENILDGHALGRTIAGVACTYFSPIFHPFLFFQIILGMAAPKL